MSELLSVGKDIKALIENLSEEEKKQALALLTGMKYGKDIAEQQKTAPNGAA